MTTTMINDIIFSMRGGKVMPAGQIASHKTRTSITIEKELKAQLQEQAKKEERSFNNLVIHILKKYMQNQQ